VASAVAQSRLNSLVTETLLNAPVLLYKGWLWPLLWFCQLFKAFGSGMGVVGQGSFGQSLGNGPMGK
jgi:hypothetical protein